MVYHGCSSVRCSWNNPIGMWASPWPTTVAILGRFMVSGKDSTHFSDQILNPTISPFLVRSLSEISFAQWKRLLLLPLKLGQGPRFGATEICNPSAGRKQQTRFLSRCVPDMLVSQGYHSRCCLVVSNFNRYGWLASEERAAKKPSRADSAGLAKVGCLDFERLWTSLGLKKRELNII